MLLPVALIALAFLAGSIPFGVVFARARGVDLRSVGSGNIGATNAARALGRSTGVLVFLCDAAKGTLPVLLAQRLFPPGGQGDAVVALTGAAAFVGHLYPPWLGLRGGKGVATAFGIFVAISPMAALASIALFAAVYGALRVSSLGSLAGATLFPLTMWHLGSRPAFLELAVFVWLLIVWRHRGNIARLLRRQESRF